MYVISIATYTPTFFGYIISVLASVLGMWTTDDCVAPRRRRHHRAALLRLKAAALSSPVFPLAQYQCTVATFFCKIEVRLHHLFT